MHQQTDLCLLESKLVQVMPIFNFLFHFLLHVCKDKLPSSSKESPSPSPTGHFSSACLVPTLLIQKHSHDFDVEIEDVAIALLICCSFVFPFQ